jgi:hypothetical protein
MRDVEEVRAYQFDPNYVVILASLFATRHIKNHKGVPFR